jgi:hypothetical protein
MKMRKRATLEHDMADEEMCTDPGALPILRSIRKNVYPLRGMNNGECIGSVNGIGFGRFVIAPAHIISVSSAFILDVEGKMIPLTLMNSDISSDCALFTFSNKDLPDFSLAAYNHLPTKTELLRFIPNSTGLLYLPKSEITLMTTVSHVSQPRVVFQNGSSKEYDHLLKVVCLSYKAPPSVRGDCGGPLILLNTKMAHKFVGMHVVGTKMCGYSSMLYKELIDGLMTTGDEEMAIETSANFLIECDSKYPVVDIMNLIQEESMVPRFKSHGDIEYIGNVRFRTQPATDTNLVEHMFYETFPVTQRPSALNLGQVKDQSFLEVNSFNEPDLVWTQFKKYSKVFDYENKETQDILSIMVEQLKEIFLAKLGKCDLSTMTETEALSGVLDDVDSHPLDMRTSAGEPWTRIGKVSGRKKNSYVKIDLINGCKRYSFNSTKHALDLKDVIDRKEAYAAQGVRIASLWKNCLKDETRPLVKCEIGKTRLFVAAPFETAYLFRKYFGKFKTAWQSKRSELKHSVGINPVSAEWTELAMYLQSKGSDCSDADFGNFDTNLRADFMEAAGDIVISTICDKNPEQRLIMDVLWDEIIRTFHLSYNMVHLTKHGNPSGNPLTTVVNCIVNLLYHWYAYIKITGNRAWSKFDEHVGLSTFGDDVIYSTIEKSTQYSFNNVKTQMDFLGQTYTCGDKSETSTAKTIKEITFLKRHFRKLSELLYLAPLDTESIEQQFNYTNIGEDDFSSVVVQLDEALIEASAHGALYFNRFNAKLTDKIRSSDRLRNNFLGKRYYSDSYQQLLKRIDNMI